MALGLFSQQGATVAGVVIGSYQIIQKLGEGGMGAVYLGRHTLLGRRAAIKVLLPALSARPDIVNRFFNEARAVTSINDAGIVQVFDFGYHTDGSAFIVMEYLEGEPLARRLERLGRLPVHEALHVCRQVASSLAAAHAQHIVHRDLKPENIFLIRDGEVASGERSKILDFGIAKLSDDHPGALKTSTGMLMGTPVYMSPEQCRGVEVDHRTDIYALGCVLFQLLTGRLPFEGEGTGDIISAHIREPAPAPSSRAADLSPAIDALVLRCLAKSPGDRFLTMLELAAALGQLVPHAMASAGIPDQAQPTMVLRPSAGLGQEVIGPGPTRLGPDPTPLGLGPAPTTLSTSLGQYAAALPRAGRVSVVAGLVLLSVGIAIAVVAMRTLSPTPVAPVIAPISSPLSPTGSSGAPAAPSVAPPIPVAPPTAPVIPTPPHKPTLRPAADQTLSPAQPERVPSTMSPALADGPAAAPVAQVHPPPTDRYKSGIRTATHPTAPVPTSAAPAPALPPRPRVPVSCGIASFAAIYNADTPSQEAVRSALTSLRACHDAGAISDAEYEQTQSALVARL